jgi:hypothetical protein
MQSLSSALYLHPFMHAGVVPPLARWITGSAIADSDVAIVATPPTPSRKVDHLL